jgi:hypothetical protein
LLAINIFDSHFKKVPYVFFLPLPCLSRKRKTVLQEREEKEKGKERDRRRKRKETIFEMNSKIAVRFFGAIPFQPYNNRKNGQFVYNFSNATLNSKLNKNWFLGVFPPNT